MSWSTSFWFVKANRAQFFPPVLCSVMSHWWFKISNTGKSHTIEIGKRCIYIRILPTARSWRDVPAHPCFLSPFPHSLTIEMLDNVRFLEWGLSDTVSSAHGIFDFLINPAHFHLSSNPLITHHPLLEPFLTYSKESGPFLSLLPHTFSVR